MVSAVEAALSPWAHHFKAKANLPVLLRWGGHGESAGIQFALGDFDRPKVEIVVMQASAVPLLVSPSLETLGEAYVEGKIDVITVAGGTTSNVVEFDCLLSLFRTITP